MSNEQVREILKAHFYGISKEQIAKVNGISQEEVAKIIENNKDQLKAISDHIKKMGG